MSTIIHEAKLL